MEIQNGEQLLEMMRGYQVSCILAAGVDLDLFGKLAPGARSAPELAREMGCDLRGVTILADALVAIKVLEKSGERYSLPEHLAPVLREDSPQSVLAMLRHQGTCLRRWANLPWTVQSGMPAVVGPSVRGEEADQAAFILAMHVVSRDVSRTLVPEINPGDFHCLLDIGGASGSWTIAWLTAQPDARAIIFDLPHVIPLARQRLAGLPIEDRVELVPGDFYRDPLPQGADLVWLSAIIHQNSPEQNRALYGRIAEAIQPRGWIYIRDIVLESSRTAPVAGALFAVNMLAATQGGNSYSFDEIAADLQAAGFVHVELVRRDEGMHSIVRAQAPA